MKKKIMQTRGLCLAALFMLFPGTAAAAAAGNNAVNLGGAAAVGPDTSATLVFVEYERMLNDGLTILGRIGNLDYEYDDGDYLEEGDGPGFEVGVRIYPAGNGMKGFYFGGAVGLWFTEWDWIDDIGTLWQTSGYGESTALDLNINIGGKFPLGGSNFHIEPHALIGNFFGVDDECYYKTGGTGTCDLEAELGFYAVGAISIGASF